MLNKKLGAAVCVVQTVFVSGRNVRNWAQLNPDEPHWAVQHLFFWKHQQAFAPHNNTLHLQPIPPLPQCWNLVLKGFRLLLSQFLCPGLFPSCAVTSGCQQATTADTDGSPGLWWLPYVTLLLWVWAFFNVFLSISHLLLCFALKNGQSVERELSGVALGEGQTWCPLIHFNAKQGLSPSLRSTFCWMIIERLKTARLKRPHFTAKKPSEDNLYVLECPWCQPGPKNWTHGEISHHNSFSL